MSTLWRDVAVDQRRSRAIAVMDVDETTREVCAEVQRRRVERPVLAEQHREVGAFDELHREVAAVVPPYSWTRTTLDGGAASRT
jgi:hypothetical protein